MAVKVDGVEIPESVIQAEISRLGPEYHEYVKREGGEPSDAQLREWAIENLVEETLFRQAAVSTQPVPSEDRVRQELEAHAEAYQDVPEAERFAKAQVALQQRRLMREIRKGVKPPAEAEVRAYYDANPDLFVAPEGVRLSHVCRFVNPQTRAAAFLDLLRIKTELEQNKMKWTEAVERYSDSFQRDYGLFATVARGELPPEIEEKLFALKEDGLSDVIDFGQQTLHLFKLMAHLQPGPVSFESVKEHLTGVLFEQSCQDALNAKFDEMKAAAVIEGLA